MPAKCNWNDDWIRENYLSYPSYSEMAKAYNRIFGTNIGTAAIKNHTNYKLNLKKPRQDYVPYTEEQITFLKEYYPNHGVNKTREEFNRIFKANKTNSAIKNFGTIYKIQVKREVMLENKLTPVRTKGKRKLRQVGDIREECGRLVIKMPDGSWESVGRGIYKLNGKEIPKDHLVIHLDGDVNNYEIDNLLAIPSSYAGLLQQYGMRSSNAEITKTGVAWCELYKLLKGERK